ncbi:MAG: sensor histidine kinase [Candidatus Zipacnadales bacterium]
MVATATATSTDTAEQRWHKEITTAERCVAFSRGVVLVTAVLMLYSEALAGREAWGVVHILAGIGAVYAVGTSVLSLLGHEREELQFPLLVADMLLITGIIYAAGGVCNEYYLLYYLPILQASIRLNFRDAIASALLSSGLYALIGFVRGPDTIVPTSAQLRAGTFAASAVFMAAFFALLSREARTHLQRSLEMAELAAALSEKNRELEEKTRALAEAQESLLRSERLAAIGELAASVGHELRNPLGVIRNAVYCLNTQFATHDATMREMLSLMDNEVSRCDRTISALLDFARPQQGVPEPVDINSVVIECLEVEPTPAGITVSLELQPDLPLAQADRHQVGQIFGNLISNAYQAMGDSGTLRVRSAMEPDERTILVEFTDNGPGIAPENIDRIFDPLFTTKAKGIGLGLVVCKRLVERQGGTLSVRSTLGEGATFTVRLLRAGPLEAACNG